MDYLRTNYLSLLIEFLIRFLAGSVMVVGLGVLLEKIFKIKEKTPKALKVWMIFVMGVVAGISVGQQIIDNIEVGKGIRIAWEILSWGGIWVIIGIVAWIIKGGRIQVVIIRRRTRVKG